MDLPGGCFFSYNGNIITTNKGDTHDGDSSNVCIIKQKGIYVFIDWEHFCPNMTTTKTTNFNKLHTALT